jgi:hypothetical protein
MALSRISEATQTPQYMDRKKAEPFLTLPRFMSNDLNQLATYDRPYSFLALRGFNG